MGIVLLNNISSNLTASYFPYKKCDPCKFINELISLIIFQISKLLIGRIAKYYLTNNSGLNTQAF